MCNAHKGNRYTHKHTPFCLDERVSQFAHELHFHVKFTEYLREQKTCFICGATIAPPTSLLVYYLACELLLIPSSTFWLLYFLFIWLGISIGWAFLFMPLVLWLFYWVFFRVGVAFLYTYGTWRVVTHTEKDQACRVRRICGAFQIAIMSPLTPM